MSEPAATRSEKAQKQHLNNTAKCTLAPSAVHGIGVFAIRDIRKGVREEIPGLIIQRWPRAVHREPFLSPNNDARPVSFMNHSDDPNYDPKTDLALHAIAKGEEIFDNLTQYKALLLDD